MNSKIIIGVIAVVLIAGGVYFVVTRNSEQPNNQQTPTNTTSNNQTNPTPTPTPTQSSNPATANWKTYNDSKYSFEIKYPQNWKLDKYTDGYNNEGPYVLVFTTGRTQIESFPFISIRENWSVNKEIEKINSSGPGTKVKSTKDINIGLISAKQITYSTDIGLDFQKTIISQGQTVFMFDSYPGDADLDKILSTFKFTK